MALYENVSIFSHTTVEISKEYIDKFQEPNIIPNYLRDLTQKTGIELATRANGAYEVKGSWMSINRAHSFLGKFLLTYGQNRMEALSLLPETTYTKEEKSGSNFINNKNFTLASSQSYKLLKKGECDLDNPDYANHVSQELPADKLVLRSSKMTPEPVVLYAGYKDTTTELESQRKTLEVLKNVYKMEQNYQAVLTNKKTGVSEEYFPIDNEPRVELLEEQPSKGEKLDQEYQLRMQNNENMYAEVGEEEQLQPYVSSFPASGYGSSVEPQLMTKLKEAGVPESCSSVMRKSSFVKTFTDMTEEEAAVKRKKVESIAESILSHVPNKDKINVVSKIEKPEENLDVTDSAAVVKKELIEDNHDDDDEMEDDVAIDDDDDYDPSENDYDDENYAGESKFKPDAAKKATPVETEADSVDDFEQDRKASSDIEYIPEKVPITKVKIASKMKTRQSKSRDKHVPLSDPLPKRSRGRPRKGFPMKLETKESVKSSSKSEVGKFKNVKKLGKGGKTKSRRGRRPKQPPLSQASKEFHCSKCPYFANKRSHLREHDRRVHITKEFKCNYCDKIFGFGKDLKRHLKTHLKPQNCCDICGKLYKGVKSLVEHRRTHDTGYVKPEFECELCNKCFSTKYVLAYHIKSEHLGMKRTFMCPTCGKSFSQKNSYVQHANVHMGFKPYKCEICDKSFSYEKSLKEHRFMHDDIRRFTCTVCAKTFRQSSAVSIHMKVHKETKDYVCMACGKGFSQKQALIRHERIHLGEKPFSCSLCGRNFTDSSILRRHMILIHKKDPKKWREDTVNNCVRRTDFFIDVLSEGTQSKQEMTKMNSEKSGGSHLEGSLGTDSPDTVDPLVTSRSEPINMTTQISAREQIHMEEFQGQNHENAVEADESVDHPYSLTVEQIQPDSVAAVVQNQDSAVHILGQKMSTVTNAVVLPEAPMLQTHSLPPSLDHKAGVGEYITGGLPSHSMPYIISQQSQGGYSYPQMVTMPNQNNQYAHASALNYQQQFTDPSSSHPYSGYPPPQS